MNHVYVCQTFETALAFKHDNPEVLVSYFGLNVNEDITLSWTGLFQELPNPRDTVIHFVTVVFPNDATLTGVAPDGSIFQLDSGRYVKVGDDWASFHGRDYWLASAEACDRVREVWR